MTKNLHLLSTRNPHFLNARKSDHNKVFICGIRYLRGLCGKLEVCNNCNPEFKEKLRKELEELKENDI